MNTKETVCLWVFHPNIDTCIGNYWKRDGFGLLLLLTMRMASEVVFMLTVVVKRELLGVKEAGGYMPCFLL